MKQIDIIIPAYNAADTIDATLQSIAEQSLIDIIHVEVVSDCSDDYKQLKSVISKWADKIDINVTQLTSNQGPGAARQTGINRTTSDFIMFVDADDILKDSMSVAKLYREIRRKELVNLVSSPFTEELEDGTTKEKASNFTWLFGKMYRRSFLKENDIQFTSTRANEDVGFNMQCVLCSDSVLKNISVIPESVYIWKYKEDSITRRDNGRYAYTVACAGYLFNMSDAIFKALYKKPENLMRIEDRIIEAMAEAFAMFRVCSVMEPDYIPTLLQSIKAFVIGTYNPIIGTKSIETPALYHHLEIRRDRIGRRPEGVPALDFVTFIKAIQVECPDEEILNFLGLRKGDQDELVEHSST